ncbi:hypothetical protein OSTOST_07242 [Ostertagia ostertagi]
MEIGRDMNLEFGDMRDEVSPAVQNVNNSLYNELMGSSGLLTIGGRVRKVSAEDLELLAELGHGSCGHVSKMRYDDNIIAVKSMPRSTNPVESKRIIMDLRILSRAYDCPHIVHSYGYIITEVMICMEAMATCLDLLLKRTGNEPIPEPIVGKMSVRYKTLGLLKKRIQPDVKPSNILLDWNGVVKLCDFGISGFLIESRAKSKLAGCPPYMAPERVRSTENTPYDIRSDVWSLGITLVELATGPGFHMRVVKIIAFKALKVFQTLLFSNSMRYHLTLMLRLTSYHTLRLYVDIWRINVDARANDLM